MYTAVMQKKNWVADHNNPDFLKQLVRGFVKSIWVYLGTAWHHSACDEVQEMAAEAYQVMDRSAKNAEQKKGKIAVVSPKANIPSSDQTPKRKNYHKKTAKGSSKTDTDTDQESWQKEKKVSKPKIAKVSFKDKANHAKMSNSGKESNILEMDRKLRP